MLAVSDDGVGMDRATQARIFEPFFTTKDQSKGTGLGLATVFGIVKQAGGSIWVYSEPGKGATFKVYLARVDVARESGPSPAARDMSRGSETVLVVDDDDAVRRAACRILVRSGYQVLEAGNRDEAVRLCEEHEGAIHALLTDVVMPQVSGPELAKQLTASRPAMKVICMSGYTDDSIVRHGVLESEIAFLQKPITTQNLPLKVREVLDGVR
jgi:CheY-like chemotaxis protein